MRFILARPFWGALLILIGVLFIIRNIFGIEFPIWGVIWPIIIIIIGIGIFLGHRRSTRSNFIFREGKTDYHENNYSVIFGKGEIDLTKIKLTENINYVDVSTVFGASRILVDAKIPMHINVSSIFSSGRLPNGDSVVFGSKDYYTKAYKKDAPYFRLKSDVVFGETNIVEK